MDDYIDDYIPGLSNKPSSVKSSPDSSESIFNLF